MSIQDKITEIAQKNDSFTSLDVYDSLSGKFTRQHISRVIGGMVKDGIILKTGSTAKSRYFLPGKGDDRMSTHSRFSREGLEEHEIYNKMVENNGFLHGTEENISSILFYVFTEMLNNAIEHSESKYIEISMTREQNTLSFIVEDYGIGVFRNVMKKRHLKSEIEAMQDLVKGKTTTQPHSHSGEGIFFTSKIVELFVLESFGYRLRADNKIHDYFFESQSDKKRGTKVTCTINLKTKMHLNDIFGQFVTDIGEVGFDKTKIKVHLFTIGTTYISRSQARRILSGLEKFKTIILDFDKVTTVGQAFADEVFRVFREQHPEIDVQAINMIEPVKFMIDRSLNHQ